MRRRNFIAGLASTTAAWPLTARAQQVGKLPTIGFLGTNTPSAQSEWTAAFLQRLHELGWVEGRTIAIEYRWAEGRLERSGELATELVRLKVDVIVTAGPATNAAKQATSVIPIVFALASDPVASGWVASLARPAAISPAYRSNRAKLLVSDSNFCVRSSRMSAGWQSLGMLVTPLWSARCTRFK